MEHGVAYDVDSVDFTPDASAEKLSELGHYEAEAKAAASSVEDILVNPKSAKVDAEASRAVNSIQSKW